MIVKDVNRDAGARELIVQVLSKRSCSISSIATSHATTTNESLRCEKRVGIEPSRRQRRYERGDRRDSLWGGGFGRQVPVGLNGGGYGNHGGRNGRSGRKGCEGSGGTGGDGAREATERAEVARIHKRDDSDEVAGDFDAPEHSLLTSIHPSSGA